MMTLLDVVSSRRKAEIFRLLFGMDQRNYHLRELTRQSGLALGTVQQELARLVKVALVTARRDGNRVYYQANQENPVYEDLRNIVLKTAGLVNVLQGALQDPGIQLAWVFGSLAANSARSESDVDLMVIGNVSLRRVAQLLSGSAERLGREINPHILTTAEFRRRKDAADHFISSVLASPRLFVIGSENELTKLGQ
jgi:predicted nucleotidyltransferase